MESYRVADYIADFVAGLGVSQVFLLPGGGAMHLVDAMGKHASLQVVPCLHEQACAIAAEAYARVTESIGVAVVTTGPGATNAITGVAGAWIESVPMLVISGQVKRADMLNGAPLRQKGVQEVDIVSIVKPITKYAVTVRDPLDIRRVLETALYLARQGRGGPVWIDVPLDVQGAPVDPASLSGATGLMSNELSPQDEDLDTILQLLKTAKRPLLLAGHGVRLAGAANLFREVAERLNVPVVTTWNALDLLPYNHPLLVGRPGVVALRGPNFAVQNCDLLIVIGSRLDNIMTAYDPHGYARHAKKVIVDIDQHEMDKLDMDFAVKSVCDAGAFLQQFKSKLVGTNFEGCDDWLSRCADWKMRFGIREEIDFKQEGPISHYQLIEALSDAIPDQTLISTGSSGLAIEVFYEIFRNKPGQRVFLTSGLGAMGYGLPAAIGACFANNCKPMVAVESDGSLQLNLQELATMRAFNLPICLIILNNEGYASIRNTQRNYFSERYVGTGPEAGLWLPDLEAIARTYEFPFCRISDLDELEYKLADAMSSTWPLIVDARIVANETLSPKVAAIPQPDGSILSMPLEDMSPLLSLEQLQQEMLTPVQAASEQARHEER